MGKASSTKKVARAASTGGGRTRRGARPWGWYGAMVVVALLGFMLILSSRNDRQAALNPLKSAKPRPPAVDGSFGGDHWHAAYGIYVCDQFLPNITSAEDPDGIHTHDDGIVHIHPFRAASAGRKATFGVFAETVGLNVSENSVQAPGGTKYENGDRCGDKKGELKVFLNGDERRGDPKDIRLRDRDKLVIAFVADGTKVPEEPPSTPNLDNLNDVGPQPETPITSPPISVAPGSTPGDSTTVSSAPATTSATSAP